MMDSNFKSLCDATESYMERFGVPAVALGVIADGQMQRYVSGVTNVNHPLPMTSDTYMQIGSITKTFTGLALLQLREAGQVDLDATVRTYLPDFAVRDAEISKNVTLRHLLTHTAGWDGDFFPETGDGDDALALYVAGMQNVAQVAPLGRWRGYNNAAYAVAGRVIEQVTGQVYEQVISERILGPLGMHNSRFFPNDIMTERFTTGHNPMPDGPQVVRPWAMPRNINSMGRLACTLNDMLIYAQFMLADGHSNSGETVVSPESMHLMRSVQAWDGLQDNGIGIVWQLEHLPTGLAQLHYGTTKGHAAKIAILPEHGLALIVLTNSLGGMVLREVLYWQFLAYYRNQAPIANEAQNASADALQAYTGIFGEQSRRFQLYIEDDKLFAADAGGTESGLGGPYQLDLCGPDTLLVVDGRFAGRTVEALRDDAGAVGWLRLLDRLYPRRKAD
jgi:CubicO group peptidase (beta-lactamase class C family)